MLTLLLAATLAGPPAPHACPAGETWSLRSAEWACRPDLEVHPKITVPLRTWERALPLVGQGLDTGISLWLMSRPDEPVLGPGGELIGYRRHVEDNPLLRWAGKNGWRKAAFAAVKIGWGIRQMRHVQTRRGAWVGFGLGVANSMISLSGRISW